MRGGAGQRGREHEQQPAVIVVGGEDVRLRRLGPVALRVHGDRLVQHPNAPLQGRADVVVAVLELQPEHLVHGPPDHVQVAQAGELPGAPAGADQLGVLVAQEEGGIGGRVVVVQQLEQEAEPTLLAPPRAALEAGGAFGGGAAVAAARADEVGHRSWRLGNGFGGHQRQLQRQLPGRGPGRCWSSTGRVPPSCGSSPRYRAVGRHSAIAACEQVGPVRSVDGGPASSCGRPTRSARISPRATAATERPTAGRFIMIARGSALGGRTLARNGPRSRSGLAARAGSWTRQARSAGCCTG